MVQLASADVVERVARELWQIEVDDDDTPGPGPYEAGREWWLRAARRVLAVITSPR